MPNRLLLPLLLTLAAPLASAQDDAARRVEREASNPMRMIIEAAKIKPKAKAPEAARPAEAPRPAARPAAEASAAAAEPRPTAAVAPAAPATPVAASATPVAAPQMAPAATSESPVPTTVPPPAGPPESAVATVEATATPRSDSLAEAAQAAAEPEPAALKLASVVEPEVPRRLIGKVRGEVQVHVAFTVQADGRVADAAVRRSSHPTLDAAVLDAVRQWRYEPIAAARPHEVQLVLRPPE